MLISFVEPLKSCVISAGTTEQSGEILEVNEMQVEKVK